MKYLSLISLLFFVNSYAQTDSTLSNPVKSIEDLCLNVVIQTDKFTGEVSYNSPDIENVSFIKYKTKGKINQYVSLSIYDSYLSGYNNVGLIILFKSGKKINRPNEKIDVNYSNYGNWRYSAFFTPTANEINLLKSDEIIGIKLYIFNTDLTEGNLIKTYANCVLVSPKVPVKKKK